MTGAPRRCAALVALLAAVGCTATRTREFAREAYALAPEAPAASRVFDAAPDAVREALRGVLAERGVSFEDEGADPLVAGWVWGGPEERAASVDLGSLRRQITRTTRAYRSWSPLDFRCEACIVRNGRLVSHETSVVEDHTAPLDPARYRVEARIEARVQPRATGTRLAVRLSLAAEPEQPPGLEARSSGRLEARLLDAVAVRLPP